MSQTKVCKDCGTRKSVERFYTNAQQDRPGQAPYRPECKTCTMARRLANQNQGKAKVSR